MTLRLNVIKLFFQLLVWNWRYLTTPEGWIFATARTTGLWNRSLMFQKLKKKQWTHRTRHETNSVIIWLMKRVWRCISSADICVINKKQMVSIQSQRLCTYIQSKYNETWKNDQCCVCEGYSLQQLWYYLQFVLAEHFPERRTHYLNTSRLLLLAVKVQLFVGLHSQA